MIKEFEEVRNWSSQRGIGGKDPQVQLQRVLQEVTEIHDGICNEDNEEIMDAIGDSIVTLINLAKLYNFTAEEALESAFGVIKYRKGITTPRGDFVRYGKLSDDDKKWCDIAQGNPGNEYFTEEALHSLNPSDFKQ
jgi:uncharacterized protein YabN with tetrapyrrole methylase and pyrophosphatase domain